MRMRFFVGGLLWLALLLLVSASLAYGSSLHQSATEGQKIFDQKCAACHSIGGGKRVGPDLQGVTQRRDLNWIKTFIAAPDKLIASGDATAKQLLAENNNFTMPTLGLTQAEIDSLAAYLENPGTAGQGPAGGAAPIKIGDPARGRSIFTGGMKLTSGGTNCLACHSVQGVTALGGGSLGPDLTHVFGRLGGAAGMSTALATLPFPTMQGVFANRPLSPDEQADLLAFFQQADQQTALPGANPSIWFWGAGILGTLIFLGGMVIYWPRQRVNAADRLRKRRSV